MCKNPDRTRRGERALHDHERRQELEQFLSAKTARLKLSNRNNCYDNSPETAKYGFRHVSVYRSEREKGSEPGVGFEPTWSS